VALFQLVRLLARQAAREAVAEFSETAAASTGIDTSATLTTDRTSTETSGDGRNSHGYR
jgi:hypothetical protein